MTIRWGIIGCGDVCEVKSGPPLYKARGSVLTMVMRRNATLAEDFARRHGVARFTNDAQEVIQSEEVDAVYIATPPGCHLHYALKVAEARKPAYVEKPMARSATECQDMVDAFERVQMPLFVAYYRRALPRFVEVQRILSNNELGQLLAVNYVYQGTASRGGQPAAGPARPGWRECVEHSGGGLILDLGSHVLDLLDFLLGPLSQVTGIAARRSSAPGPNVPEDTVVATFRSATGALGSCAFHFHTSRFVDRLHFVGTHGDLSLSVFGQEPLRHTRGCAVREISVPHPAHVQQPLIQSIVNELNGQHARCPSTGQSALRTSAVIDQLLKTYYAGREDAFWTRPATWPGTQNA